MDFWARTPGPLLYAHRGASAELPENTLPAFRRALELGADVLECDVHATRDGVFVISHDPTGLRTCGVPRRIAECSYREVATWDAGFGFVDAEGRRPYAGSGLRLVRLEAALEELPEAAFNVDVKEATVAEVRALVALLDTVRARDRVLLTSFSARVIGRLRRAGDRGITGISRLGVASLYFAPARLLSLFRPAGARAQIPTRAGGLDLATPGFVRKCHRVGIAVDYWVINDPEGAARLLDLGADGIMTDDPCAIAPVFERSPRTEAWRARHRRSGTTS
ncbi:MAG: glycerophosphodiester phosphodiesterase [Pseudomonadota bacterium]|nr:MAG: glycerophosphodiester phosphodiesterase [Pseudomonadota bacterium]